MSQAPAKFLTTRQLARLWMVSEATIKRWADAGHLRFSRTVGGHRRFSLEDVARFQSARGLGAPAESAAAGRERAGQPRAGRAAGVRRASKAAARTREAARAFYEAVLQAREGAATAIILELYLGGVGLARIFDEVVADAMHRIGAEWHGGTLTVADEHFATRTAIRALDSISFSVRREAAGAPVAVCCAVEDEHHEVPVLCAQVLLEGEGWRVCNLGTNTPFSALADAVEKYGPRLVCVSATTADTALGRSPREYRLFHEAARAAGARVVLGGEGFRDAGVRARLPADLYAGNFQDLMKFIEA